MATRKSKPNPAGPTPPAVDPNALEARISALESKLDQLLALLAPASQAAQGRSSSGSTARLVDVVRQQRGADDTIAETAASTRRGAGFASLLFNAELCVQNNQVTIRFAGDSSEITLDELLRAGGRIQLDIAADGVEASALSQQLPTLESLFNFLVQNDELVRGVGAGAQCPPGENCDDQN